MTNKEKIKSWFTTGSKPTQYQFWTWMDSYWHKDETIPQANIEGLDKSLEAKAEATAVEDKANKEATNLSEENVTQWKEALGVGELPSNIATVDEEEKVGNVHTKEQIGKLLDKKLTSPTEVASIDDYPYVVAVDQLGYPARLQGWELGKNVANSKPTTEAGAGINLGAIWDIDTKGFPLRIRGLDNKKIDPTHNLKVKMNADGQLSVSDEPDLVVSIPEEFKSTASIASTTINVNHIFPNPVPELPNFAEEIKQIMAEYKNYNFERVTGEQINLWLKDGQDSNANKIEGNSILIDSNRANFGQNIKLIEFDVPGIILPHDKNFIVDFEMRIVSWNNTGENIATVGLSQSGIMKYGVTKNSVIVGSSGIKVDVGPTKMLIIKTGGVITTILYNKDKTAYYSGNSNSELGGYQIRGIFYGSGADDRYYLSNRAIMAIDSIKYKILN